MPFRAKSVTVNVGIRTPLYTAGIDERALIEIFQMISNDGTRGIFQ
jgi:hypothetical protein